MLVFLGLLCMYFNLSLAEWEAKQVFRIQKCGSTQIYASWQWKPNPTKKTSTMGNTFRNPSVMSADNEIGLVKSLGDLWSTSITLETMSVTENQQKRLKSLNYSYLNIFYRLLILWRFYVQIDICYFHLNAFNSSVTYPCET